MFPIKSGLKQGDVLLPLLFKFAVGGFWQSRMAWN